MPKGNAKETERRIFAAAVTLFNERGYDDVSLRDIAKEAGTTIGNMTYHFSKKEDLLLCIVEGLHQEFGETQKVGNAKDPLNALVDSLVAAESNRKAYPFYYRHMNQVIGSSDALLKRAGDFQAWLYREYRSCLLNMRDAGCLRDEVDGDTLEFLAMLILSIEVCWAQPASPSCNEALPRMGLTHAVANVLSPYLTVQGSEALKRRQQDIEVEELNR